MHINQISYVKTFNLGNYSSEKIGVEIAINEGEDAKKALDTARNLVEEYHQSLNYPTPHIEERTISTPIPDIQIEKPEISTLEAQIMSCTEFKVLETYYFIVKNKPELQTVYDIKKKQLVAKEAKELIDKTDALCNSKTKTINQ